ncbi:type III PLP-dependent enzyme [Streptomyces sp. CB01201]|uniref:type III PLP-dependent enzyme n=1 Tax=Streptomyces sp. CB01201 TaxID=2020324 RepID=UPI0018FE8E13|nr:type III PLP-dependent enzyme [Streptomyces sp. CB01201]
MLRSELAELAEFFGTPLYVYDLDRVDAAYTALRSALPAPSELYYSLKANPLAPLAARLADLGCRAEVSSQGELTAAVGAGFDPGAFLYTGPAKRPADLDAALALGCTQFSIESPADARLVHAAAARARRTVTGLIRVNVERAPSGTPMAFAGSRSSFGTGLSTVLAEPHLFRPGRHLRIAGAHLFLAGNIADGAVLLDTLGLAARTTGMLAQAGFPLEIADLGGGFGSPYAQPGSPYDFSQLAGGLAPVLDEALPGWRAGHPSVRFESGRYLAGSAGTLVVRVRDVKQSGGQRQVLVDSGIHHLGGMAGLRRVPPAQVVPLTGKTEGPQRAARLVGELCTPLDLWSSGASLPESVAPGDLLAVPNVGAYGLTASLVGFLSHPCPIEVTVADGQVTSATRARIVREDAVVSERTASAALSAAPLGRSHPPLS